MARKFKSSALAADAFHFASDIWSTLAVLAGLLSVRAGFAQGDSIAALAVAAT